MALRLFGKGRPQDAVNESPTVAPEPAATEAPDGAEPRRTSRVLEPVQGDISPADFPESEARRRRRRRSRGRGANGEAQASDGVEPEPVVVAEAGEVPGATPSPRRRARQPRREATDAPAPEPEAAPAERPSRRTGGGSGKDADHLFSMLESLIARQNVILETFAQKQLSAIRSIENSMIGLSQRMGGDFAGTGVSGAMPRVGIFVDVPNIIYAAERLGVSINFGKLMMRLTRGRSLVRASAYAPISDDPQTRLEQQKFVSPFVNYGYRIVTKPFKRFADGSIKGNFDVELAMDVLTMSERLDVVSLVSGDGDFRRLCELVASRGIRVEVVAFGTSTASELRAVADDYIDLQDQLNDLAD